MKTSLLFFCSIFLSTWVNGQQFITIGSAKPMQNSCILLTPDYPYSEGIAYSKSKLDLSQPFEISFDIYLGNKNDDGADGIAFVYIMTIDNLRPMVPGVNH